MTRISRLLKPVGRLIVLTPYFLSVITCASVSWIVAILAYPFRRICKLCNSRKVKSDELPTVVFLGTGWGCYATIYNINRNLYNIIVISPRDHFLFTPLLCGTAVGTVESRSIIEPLYHSQPEKSNYQFMLGEATSVNFEDRLISYHCLRSNAVKTVRFDRLVIGVGATTRALSVPGVEEHALFLKEASDAVNVRRKFLKNVYTALSTGIDDTSEELLHVTIVGGGPTGVELTGELLDLFNQDLSELLGNLSSLFKITIIEKSGILASFHPKLQNYATNLAANRSNIEVRKGAVSEVLADGVLLQDGSVIRSRLVIWTAGIMQRPFTKSLQLEKNERGQILVDDKLTVIDKGLHHVVYGLGDCAQIQNNALPCTAQVAMQQGEFLAYLLNQSSSGNIVEAASRCDPFAFKSLGVLAYMGEHKAIANLEALPCHIQLTGVLAFILWRLAYLYRLFSWRQRVQVPIDWFKSAVFGRDISNII